MSVSSTQRFNHVALSVPSEMLDEDGRAEILDFYREAFGWAELPITIDRKQFVLQAHSYEQFVFLIAEDDPMRAAPMDHFGLSVASAEEHDELYARCQAYAARDDRVELTEKVIENQHDVVLLHSFYVRFLLPMMLEVQYFEWINEDVAALVASQRT